MSKIVDESSVGIWLWLVLITIIVVLVIAMDLWLYTHGHEYLTTEYKEGLKSAFWGPILVFFSIGTVAALMWHFYTH